MALVKAGMPTASLILRTSMPGHCWESDPAPGVEGARAGTSEARGGHGVAGGSEQVDDGRSRKEPHAGGIRRARARVTAFDDAVAPRLGDVTGAAAAVGIAVSAVAARIAHLVTAGAGGGKNDRHGQHQEAGAQRISAVGIFGFQGRDASTVTRPPARAAAPGRLGLLGGYPGERAARAAGTAWFLLLGPFAWLKSCLDRFS